MAKPPPPPVRKELSNALAQWRALDSQIDELQKKERALRLYIAKQTFSKLREGVNHREVGALVVTVNHKVNRKLDVAVLNNSFRNKLKDIGASLDLVVEYKPGLVLSEYRKLTAQQRKLFDTALTISEGTPTLTVEDVK